MNGYKIWILLCDGINFSDAIVSHHTKHRWHYCWLETKTMARAKTDISRRQRVSFCEMPPYYYSNHF